MTEAVVPNAQSSAPPARRLRWRRPGHRATTILALVLGLVMVLALHTHGKVIRNNWYPFAVWLLAPGVMAWLWARTDNPGITRLRRWYPLIALSAIFLLFVFSSATFHKWFFYMRWAPAGGHGGGLGRFALLLALITPLYAWGQRRGWSWLLPLLVLLWAEALCIGALFEQTGGRALYRTDHPSFMFRLWEFSRSFPQLVNYLPNWNGGVEHVASIVSGTGAPGMVLLPLFRYFPIHEVYTLAWATLFLVVIPWLGVWSVRVLGGSWTSAFIGGVLSLALSQHFYLWALHFGTIGATFTASMTMPVCALGYRIVQLRRYRRTTVAALIVTGFMLLQWPPGALVAGSVGLATLLAARRWNWRQLRVLALIGGCILLLYSPWLVATLMQARSTLDFVVTPVSAVTPAAAEDAMSWADRWAEIQTSLIRGLMLLKYHTLEMNPLIIIFGFVGVLAGVDRRLRRWYLPILLVLALITAWAREFLPHSQLGRMAIPLAFAGVVPAALFLGRLLRVNDRRLAGVRAGILAALICSGVTVVQICSNRGPARFLAMGEQVDTLVDWIRENTPTDARILFAGKCVHRYGGGNVAYLSVLAEREMMAVDYYGFPPEQVLYEYPPRAFRQTPELLALFFDSYNVSHIVTYHEDWKRHFRAEPALYTERATLDTVTIFERTSHPGMFLQGSGRVQATRNRITVTLDDPRAPAVVAYNWAEGLRAPPPVTIHPHVVTNGLVLVGIEPNGQREFTLQYRPRMGQAQAHGD